MLMLLAIILTGCATPPPPPQPHDPASHQRIADAVTIHRSAYGVPHVTGPTDASVVFGFMYARCEDEFARIEQSIISMIGRSAEINGEAGIELDQTIRAFEIPTHAQRAYKQAPDDVRALLDAAAAGVNHYLATHPEVEPLRLTAFEPWYFIAQSYGFHLAMFDIDPGRSLESLAQATPTWEVRDGSNMWAIGPSRTANGSTMLFINPHIPLEEAYEACLRSDEGLQIYGMTAYGSAILPLLGHTPRHGWSLTVNYPDILDIYAVQFDDPGNPSTYRHGETVRSARTWTETIDVLVDGEIEQRDISLMRTHHGPVLAEQDGIHYAVRIGRLDEDGGRLTEQWYRMATATDFDAFKDAVGMGQLPFHNIMYADRDGNTWYVYNCAMPRRDPAFDWRGVVDGNVASTDWIGYHPADELPQVVNPEAGWMQNCNSSPFTTTEGDNPEPDDFPLYIARDDRDGGRVLASSRILSANADFTYDEWAAAAWDTRVYEASRHIPAIRAAVDALADREPDRAAALEDVVSTLESWDQVATIDCDITTIFMIWFEVVLPHIWSGALNDAIRISSLELVMTEIEKSYGTWRIPWGEVNRLQRVEAGEAPSNDRESWPIAGGHGAAGIVNCFLARSSTGTKRRWGFHGHSYVSVVEFGRDGVRAGAVIPYGISRDPSSPHYTDQAPLYAAGTFKDVTFDRREIERAAMRSYHPGDAAPEASRATESDAP